MQLQIFTFPPVLKLIRLEVHNFACYREATHVPQSLFHENVLLQSAS